MNQLAEKKIASPASVAFLAMLVLFLSITEMRLIRNNFGSQLGLHVQASQGVVEGLPHWRVFQSRVLGPYMVHAVQRITGLEVERAYALMMFVWLTIFFGVLAAASVHLWRSPLIATAIAGCAAFLNATLMQEEWLYPWDYLDLTIFTLIAWAILRSKPWPVIAALVIVEIFNRELATIVALWLALDALLDSRMFAREAAPGSSRRSQLVAGLSLVAVSLVTAEALRSLLLVREIGPEIFPPPTRGPESLLAWRLWSNLSWLAESLASLPNLRVVYPLIVLAILVLCIMGIKSGQRETGRISVIFLVLWVFTFCFGLIDEPRVWLAFVPYLVLAGPRILFLSGATLQRSGL